MRENILTFYRQLATRERKRLDLLADPASSLLILFIKVLGVQVMRKERISTIMEEPSGPLTGHQVSPGFTPHHHG